MILNLIREGIYLTLKQLNQGTPLACFITIQTTLTNRPNASNMGNGGLGLTFHDPAGVVVESLEEGEGFGRLFKGHTDATGQESHERIGSLEGRTSQETHAIFK